MKTFFNSIKIITIAAVLAVGVSYVSAAPWSAPTTGATGGNTVASVNVSDYAQTKIGSFTTDNFFKAGGVFNATGASWNKPGYAIAEKAFISPWSFFTSAFLPGNTSQVKIGGGDDATTDIFNAAVTPFTIDLAGRGSGNNSVSGRQVIDIRTDTIACYPNATIRTNTPAVRLLNSKTGDDADAIVRGVQLSGGNPAPGKILVSTDSDGNAVWGTPTLSNGKIVFTYGASPAATGQALCSNTPNPIPGCTNSAATNYNANATVDNGSCTFTPNPIPGCTNPTATNYNPNATVDDGSCVMTVLETFDWSVGQFSSCNAPSSARWQNYSQNMVGSGSNIKCSDWLPKTLPGGTQSRSVTCVNTTTNQVAPNDQCNQATKPISEQSCAYTTSYRTVKEKILQTRTSPTSYRKSVQSTEILNNICASPFVAGQNGYYPKLSNRCDSVAIDNSSGSGRNFTSICTTPVAPNVGNFYPVDTSVTSDVFYRSSYPDYEYYKYILQVLKP